MTSTSRIPVGYKKESAPSRPMDDAVCLSMIRLWCEVLEDVNPVYYDGDVARANGFDGIVAPPPMIMAWSGRPEWTPAGAAPSISDQFKDESADYPHAVGLSSVQIHSRPLRLGERLNVHEFVSDLSDPHETPRGFGCRQQRYTALRDEWGAEIASIEFEALRMKMTDGDETHEPALREMPRFVGPPAAGAADARDGQVLPELSTRLTLKRCIKWVAASRDYHQVHLDRDHARHTGAPDLYIGIHFFHGLVCRFITDWTGPSGVLRRMEFTHWGRCFPDETVTVAGMVKSAPREGDDTVLDLEIAVGCDRGRLYDVLATVSLNQRGS